MGERKVKWQILAGKCVPMGITENKCGACTQCCTNLDVIELGKKAGEPCKHLTNSGCGIYESRPQSCRDFDCGYLLLSVKPKMRPDRSGFVMYLQEPDSIPTILCMKNTFSNINKNIKRYLQQMCKKAGLRILWRNPDGTIYER